MLSPFDFSSAPAGSPRPSQPVSPSAAEQQSPPPQSPQSQQPVNLSLKVMVAAGTVCSFLVGGAVESAPTHETASLPVSLPACLPAGRPPMGHTSLFCVSSAADALIVTNAPPTPAHMCACSAGNSSLVTHRSQRRHQSSTRMRRRGRRASPRCRLAALPSPS